MILSGDTAAEIDALQRQGTGEILAQGGASFAKSLVKLDVPDVYRLTAYPCLAGDGPRLFTNTQARELKLVSRTDFANGVLALEYRRRR